MKRVILLLLLLVFVGSQIHGFSLFGLFKKKKKEPQKRVAQEAMYDQTQSGQPQSSGASRSEGMTDDVLATKMSNSVGIPDENLTEEIIDKKRKLKRLVMQKQFSKILEYLTEMPDDVLTNFQLQARNKLIMFKQVEDLAAENAGMFKGGDTQSKALKKSLKRLYRGAQMEILKSNSALAKDLLVQSIFLDRTNFKSKKLMELGLNLPIGSYKVEDLEKKYWQNVDINIYSGYPARAVDDLKILQYFDPENSTVFEKMGSAYYLMGDTKNSVVAWKRAAYLNPANKDLDEFIEKAEKEVKRQKEVLKEMLAKKKAAMESEDGEEVDMKILSVFNESNRAYSYAREVKKTLAGQKVTVEELDNGKWAVMVPKPKKDDSGDKKKK
ncbi:hypothetical protein DID75_05540 [Candidatus Marinamargulisbacteria bacterium SCGC AG-410-N11]|nr:hypothetical protein DID75_05540 [Candidatus Marinamargulisbacteria bacterium SCGC AG-410-N11]